MNISNDLFIGLSASYIWVTSKLDLPNSNSRLFQSTRRYLRYSRKKRRPRDWLRASSVSFGSSLPPARRPSLGREAAMSLIFDSLLCLNRFHLLKDWEEYSRKKKKGRPRDKLRASSVSFRSSLPPARRPSLGGNEPHLRLPFVPQSIPLGQRLGGSRKKKGSFDFLPRSSAVIYMEHEIKAQASVLKKNTRGKKVKTSSVHHRFPFEAHYLQPEAFVRRKGGDEPHFPHSLLCLNRFHSVRDWEKKGKKMHPLTSSNDRSAVIYMELEIKALSFSVDEKATCEFLKIG
ncbi:hypothetical protein CEXT_597811 [Caerostris extrusa]|uniref:Ribosomal protein S4 n=1 Tax=Caerostris extrusa TaxID=172846 RepID=A0AAV4UBZ1_CAEEX|nr:hypothetical protein CEXT_597811 [Caerostris extrusa]